MVDVVFPARNRLEFTRESLAALKVNTDWSLVDTLFLYDDQSVDGTRQYLEAEAPNMPVKTVFHAGVFNNPLAVLLDAVHKSESEYVAKVDNDAMMPPGWLGVGLEVAQINVDLDLLGIAFRDGLPARAGETEFSYSDARFIGGIGLFRRKVLEKIEVGPPAATQHWAGINQADMHVGWLKPGMAVFLLDWLPFSPWVDHSERYEALGWQRRWGRYSDRDTKMWDWWFPSCVTT